MTVCPGFWLWSFSAWLVCLSEANRSLNFQFNALKETEYFYSISCLKCFAAADHLESVCSELSNHSRVFGR